MIIRPCKGRSVRKEHPPHAMLKADGENVDPSPYYNKRIARGDAEVVEPKPRAAKKTAKKVT
jgi:hypothetical protein